ncbi:hypothetical protein [Agrobacterium rosae]|uniref:Uncharacterized protein n=1 Tax=Agrobacterium rosae TaxID=1972867 RepID=A0A1R3U337_9HYPH|nr:hypothetical protein [Agrobacterium rosae]SCX36003.1 hypothetical protein DSM25559_5275 [Agrobacterium rosae]
MSRAVVRYQKQIQTTRQTLDDWTAYEAELDQFWSRSETAILYDFESIIASYHHNLAVAGSALNLAIEMGGLVDISETSLAHDIRSIANGKRNGHALADKHRARSNLVKWDFYERFGRATEVTVFKFTILRLLAPTPARSISDLATYILMPVFRPVVVLSFDDPAAAMLYRLAV